MVELSGYKLTFDDEFNTCSISQNGTGTVWSDIRPQWRQDAESDTGFGHSSFVDPGSGYDPFKVSGGALSITAVPDRTPYGVPGSYESGLIGTQNSFSQTYGYFEMRAETSNAKGSWDAFWMLPEHPTGNQELDIMEHLGNNDHGTYSTIHTLDNIPAQQLQVYSQNDAREAGYHTYGMDWEPDRISFYVDGQLMGSQATPSDMHSPMYLLADLATEANASDPALTTNIDYIRAFSKDPSATAIVQQPTSAPDGADPGLYGATTAGNPVSTAPSTPTSKPSQPTAGASNSASTISQSGEPGIEALNLYYGLLDRAPDPNGFQYWTANLKLGWSVEEVAQAFLNGQEYQVDHPHPMSNADFVTALYADALGRAPDAGGAAYWMGQLSSGAETRAQVAAAISEGPEARSHLSSRIDKGFQSV